jgi:uncharacterized protein
MIVNMRLLALADEAPPLDADELVARNRPDAVVTLGDLPRSWLAALEAVDVPRLGVHGNHDGVDDLREVAIDDVHLSRVELDGWSFSGFEGCVRYRKGPHQYSQRQAARMARRLPAADVLLCHTPPFGVNDEPDDPAHVGFEALRGWVERHEPRYVLHGHTTPDPRTRVDQLGATQVVWVRGARLIELER